MGSLDSIWTEIVACDQKKKKKEWTLDIRLLGLEFQTSHFNSCIIRKTEVNMEKGLIGEPI